MGKASRRRRDADVHGIVVVDKPAGITSHDAVGMVRKALGTSRVGHSGTLDPDATGVLVVGVGHYTRVLPYFAHLDKAYTGWIECGVATDSLDATGEITDRADMSGLTRDEVAKALGKFRGEIWQVPPMVSARRVGGERLHAIARRGEVVEREARAVQVYRLELDEFEVTDHPRARIEVECSTGTYVRTLAADIGAALGGCAHLSGLRRTRIGNFTEANASSPTEPVLVPTAEALGPLAPRQIDADTVEHIRHGRRPPAEADSHSDGEPFALVDAQGDLVAVAHVRDGLLVPLMVLPVSR